MGFFMFKVFVSYAREDEATALEIFDWLGSIGVEPWMDQRRILPGQNWEAEIEKAFNDANVILLLLSPRSVSKRGFVQREANEALQKLVYKLPTDVYAIPILLEACEVPSHISARLQHIAWDTPFAKSSISASLALAAEQQSIKVEEGSEFGIFRVLPRATSEKWEALPGHDIAIAYPRFTSQSAIPLAEELSRFFEGRAAKVTVDARQKTWEQSPELFEGNYREAASNGRWDDYQIAYASDRVLSVVYNVGWYGAGAAHPNSHFETYNFVLDPFLVQFELGDLFVELEPALEVISAVCITELRKEYWLRFGRDPSPENIEWLQRGAGASSENFGSFSMSEYGLTFLFPPYQVAPYVCGTWSVLVSFYDLRPFLRSDGPYALIRRPSSD
ncbi:TIR domain-containing protein [Xanthomonas sacchari]|uniref:TIR domain-containing protein n=1 Tax=Xanthomonas sacchari TaxID=56458 RepID=UPI002254D83E|nr:TIR domain-containing protein [Xanthomonas sacchari]